MHKTVSAVEVCMCIKSPIMHTRSHGCQCGPCGAGEDSCRGGVCWSEVSTGYRPNTRSTGTYMHCQPMCLRDLRVTTSPFSGYQWSFSYHIGRE